MNPLFIQIIYTIIIVFIFSFIFKIFTNKDDWLKNHNSNDHNLFDMFYFTNTSYSTFGYGDIVPKSTKSRLLVMCLQLLILFQIVSILTGYNYGIDLNEVSKIFKHYLKTLVTLFIFVSMFILFTDDSDWSKSVSINNINDMIYFTHTSLAAICYGDIYPKTKKSRIMVMIMQGLIMFEFLKLKLDNN